MTDSASETSPEHDGRLGSFAAMLAALSASAGWGVFLINAALRAREAPAMKGLRGILTYALLAWFAGAIPLTLAVMFKRDALLRQPGSRLRTFAWLAVIAMVGAFAGWFVVTGTLPRPARG